MAVIWDADGGCVDIYRGCDEMGSVDGGYAEIARFLTIVLRKLHGSLMELGGVQSGL